jgi:hypothetical protein
MSVFLWPKREKIITLRGYRKARQPTKKRLHRLSSKTDTLAPNQDQFGRPARKIHQ